LKVLVVDDEPDARALVQSVLEDGGAIVTVAKSAAEGLAAIASGLPDVIVSDIGMPEADGYEFVRRLRQLPREKGGRIPAVALTAYARAEDRRKALLAGFQNHAAKPVDPQELVVVVANLAGRYA
jgi:CheY-like chemotaxis protein